MVQTIQPGSRLLDLGCGTQLYLLRYVSNIINEGVGIDFYHKKLALIKQSNIKYVQWNGKNELPLPPRSFDTVTLLAVIEHIPLENVEAELKEMKRVLKKKGKIVLTTPTPLGKIVLEFLAFRLRVISEKQISDHKKYYTKSDFESLCKKVGLKLVTYQTFQLGCNSYVVLEK